MTNEATEKAAKQAREMFRAAVRLMEASMRVAECRPAARHLARALNVFGEVGFALTAQSSYDEGFTDGEADAHEKLHKASDEVVMEAFRSVTTKEGL